jgi:hypothetical protein
MSPTARALARDRWGHWFEVYWVSATCHPGSWWVASLFGGKFLSKELWGYE